MPRNPDRNYAIHWLDQGARDAAVAAIAGATGTGTTPTDATGELEGDVRGELLGPLYVVAIHGDEITPPALAADADDYDPAARDALLWRLDFATFALTGIAAPQQPGEWHVLAALSAGVLRHADAGSADENQILCPGDADLAIPVDGAVVVLYDGTSARWRVVGGTGSGGLTPGSYTVTNGTTDRTYDADSLTVNELADIVFTLIADLGGT